MNRITRGIRKINQHVATAGQVAQDASRQLEEIRQTVSTTTGQLQNLRAELPQWTADLQAGSEARIAEAMQEVNDADALLDEAGFAIGGIDLEISPTQKIILHLMMTREVSPREIERMARAQAPGMKKALLSALTKAREIGQTFAPAGLPDHRVQIVLGPTPTVRLVWRNESTEFSSPAMPPPPPGQDRPPPAAPAASSFISSLNQAPGGFFGSPSPSAAPSVSFSLPPPLPASTATSGAAGQGVPAQASPPEPTAAPPTAPVDPLARFKVMPFKTR